jgi:peptide chain release factor 3
VIQVLRYPHRGDQEPVLAAVGPMQFEVAQHRLENEFHVPVALHPTDYVVARVTDEPGERALASIRDAAVLHRSDGARLALFKSHFMLERFERDNPQVALEKILAL